MARKIICCPGGPLRFTNQTAKLSGWIKPQYCDRLRLQTQNKFSGKNSLTIYGKIARWLFGWEELLFRQQVISGQIPICDYVQKDGLIITGNLAT